jgi:hypothetical protein
MTYTIQYRLDDSTWDCGQPIDNLDQAIALALAALPWAPHEVEAGRLRVVDSDGATVWTNTFPSPALPQTSEASR